MSSIFVNATELRAALTLAAIYILRMLGLFMVMPVLAILAVDFPDYTPWLVGIAIGGYGLTQKKGMDRLETSLTVHTVLSLVTGFAN